MWSKVKSLRGAEISHAFLLVAQSGLVRASNQRRWHLLKSLGNMLPR